MTDTATPGRHNPPTEPACGVERWLGYPEDPIHVCQKQPGHLATDRLHACRCGSRWDQQGRAPVEDLLGADPDRLGGQDVDTYIREARRD